MRHALRLLPLAFLLLAFYGLSCSSSSDASTVASELADRLTEALDVKDGRLVEGTPPEGDESGSAPQIRAMSGTDEFRFGAPWHVVLGTDFKQAGEVSGAIIWVEGATKHYRVDRPLEQGEVLWESRIEGLLEADDALDGESFKIEFGLRMVDGTVGGYGVQPVEIQDQPSECPVTDPCCNGGVWQADGTRCDAGGGLLSGVCNERECVLTPLDLSDGDTTDGDIAQVYAPSQAYCKSSQCFGMVPTGIQVCFNGQNMEFLDCEAIGGTSPNCDEFSTSCDTNVDFTAINQNCFCGQDAQYDRGLRSYTCMGPDGSGDETCSLASAGEGSTVQVGNLPTIWQRYVPDVIPGCSGGGEIGSLCTWQEAINYCDSLVYADKDDWRLPSPHELLTIADHSRNNPSVPADIFTINSQEVANVEIWSGAELFGDTSMAWVLVRETGALEVYDKAGDTLRVRCVREDDPPGGDLDSSGRFEESGADMATIVKDRVTGLTWLRSFAMEVDQPKAMTYCEWLDIAGFNDWRVPDVNELASLMNYAKDGPASDFPGIDASYYRTATFYPYGETLQVWAINLVDGGVEVHSLDEYKNVLCVRNE